MKSFLYEIMVVVHPAPFPHHHFSLFHSLLFIGLFQVTAFVFLFNSTRSVPLITVLVWEKEIVLLSSSALHGRKINSTPAPKCILVYQRQDAALQQGTFCFYTFYNWGSINLADGGRPCKNETHTFHFSKGENQLKLKV